MAVTPRGILWRGHQAARWKWAPRLVFPLTLLLGGAVALASGMVVGTGGSKSWALLVAAAGAAAGTFAWSAAGHRFPAALGVEVPILLLLFGNQVLRVRTTTELAANPVDSAGTFRLSCVALAGLLGVLALLSKRSESVHTSESLLSRPFRLYCLYAVVVFLGVTTSVDPPLTAYRGIELAATLIVMLGAWTILGAEAPRRVGNILFWFVAALVGTVWLGVLFAPSHAIGHFQDLSIPIGFEIVGALPAISSNSVGLIGVLLAVWSLARVTSSNPTEQMSPVLGYGLSIVGVITLLGAQYRTGYVALIVALPALLFLRRKWGLMGMAALGLAALLILAPGVIKTVEPYALRGTRSINVATLDSRTLWWSQAMTVWRKDPLVGRGLLTATRFEVLEPLGFDQASTIHGGWVEALVGTGLIGITLLALAFLITFKRAVVEAFRDRGTIVPVLLLLVLSVRSITGSAFESSQDELLIFLWIALWLQPDSAAFETADARSDERTTAPPSS